MISITTTQIDAWIVAFAYPLVRILAFIAAAPLWSTAGIPRRTRVILGLCVTIALVPALPTMPAVAPGSLTGLWILAQQMLIGIGMGFAARIVFSAVDMAGEFIGAQMGLGFATAYDPLSSSQTPVISEFLSLIGLLLFLFAPPLQLRFFLYSVWAAAGVAIFLLIHGADKKRPIPFVPFIAIGFTLVILFHGGV